MGVGVTPSLATDPLTGLVYVATGAGNPVLFTVNPVNAMTALVGNTGLGFANPEPPTLEELVERWSRVLKVRGLSLLEAGDRAMELITERAKGFDPCLIKTVSTYFTYFADGYPQFDMSNIEEVCGTLPPHPPLDVATLTRFYRFAVDLEFRSFP